MKNIQSTGDERGPKRWSEQLSWLRAVLQAVQTIAILVRIWQNF